MKPIRVLLADDHVLVRAGLRTLLSTVAGVEVVAEAGNGQEALERLAASQPDVIVTDIAMPGMNGLELLTRITADWPQVRVLVLSMHGNEEYVLQSLRSGAAGYLLKDAAPAELETALHAVVRGETYISPAISKHVVRGLAQRPSEQAPALKELTPRQREVLQMIADGVATKIIAKRLGISIKTVETHRTQLMDRLEIHDIPGLVRFAIREGLVRLDQ